MSGYELKGLRLLPRTALSLLNFDSTPTVKPSGANIHVDASLMSELHMISYTLTKDLVHSV